jgi:hypothetical protein
MICLALACLGLVAKVSREEMKRTYLWLSGTILFYGAMIAWLWLEAGAQAFRGSETGLIGWFIIGLALFLIGELLPVIVGRAEGWSFVATVPGAISFALGFDAFRPDDYSYVPGAILGILILLVAVQAFLSLRIGLRSNRFPKLFLLALYILSFAFLVYAATAKMIDRGWIFPWAYLASGGALLFAAGQIWNGWAKVLNQQSQSPQVRVAAVNFGQLLMVVAAIFIYREFL